MAERPTPGDYSALEQAQRVDNASTRALAGVDYFNSPAQAAPYAQAFQDLRGGLLGFSPGGAQASQPDWTAGMSDWSFGAPAQGAPPVDVVPHNSFGIGLADRQAGGGIASAAPAAYSSFGPGLADRMGHWSDGMSGWAFGPSPAQAAPAAPQYADVPLPPERPADLGAAPAGGGVGAAYGGFGPGLADRIAPSPAAAPAPAAAPPMNAITVPAPAPAPAPAMGGGGGWTSAYDTNGYNIDPLTGMAYGPNVYGGWNLGGLLGVGGDAGGGSGGGGGWGGYSGGNADGGHAGGGFGGDSNR